MNNPVPRVEQFLERGKQQGVVAAVAGELALLQMSPGPMVASEARGVEVSITKVNVPIMARR
jgi:hypothetical protein